MRVLITGSSGYLGSILTDFLISKKIPVIGLDLKNNVNKPSGEYFTFYPCCITDKEQTEEIFSREKPTHVVHFACTFNKIRDRNKEHSIDVGGSGNILDISNRTFSVKQLIYSSSAAAYGAYIDNPEWIKESHPLRPGKYRYGIHKRMIEHSFLNAVVREELNILVLRICTVTGPCYTSERMVLELLTKFPYLPRFCKHFKIQLLHEEDFLILLEKIMMDDIITGIYNIAPASYSYINDLAPGKKYFILPKEIIKSILWVLWHLRILNLQPAAINNSIFPIILDPARLVSRYDYKFRYSTAEAFADTLRARGKTDKIPGFQSRNIFQNRITGL
jgi:UDP-glucose 4-epimerase